MSRSGPVLVLQIAWAVHGIVHTAEHRPAPDLELALT